MTVLTDTQVITASGGLVELGYSQITSSVPIGSTTEASGTSVIGTLTVVCDGSPILVEFFSPAITVASSTGATVGANLVYDGTVGNRLFFMQNSNGSSTCQAPAHSVVRLTPSSGVHTFAVTAFNSVTGGFIGANSAHSHPAFLRVSKVVTATQWPAATTGTIICTSSTRPASPFAGQQIYETDTNLVYVYSGSAWVKVLQQKSTTTTGWTNATYTNSWVSYGSTFSPARYIKDDLGVVHLDGLIMNGTIGTSAFTLPAGFRPAYQQIYAALCNPNAIGRLDILTNGQVQPAAGSNVSFSLAGVTFLAEA